MSMLLVDTDVISATSPAKPFGREVALQWLAAFGNTVHLSAVTVAELRYGVALLIGAGATRKASLIAAWQDQLLSQFRERILDVDEEVAWRAGDLLGAAEARGQAPSLADACIGATAILHGLTVVARNRKHFDALGISSRRPEEFGAGTGAG